MFQLDILMDTSLLPSNGMSLRDDDFIEFVKNEAGCAAAALLEIQGINCIKSLLMTDNVYAVMELTLTFRRGNSQLSNFYRHLQGLSNVCSALKKMLNNSQLPLSSSTNNLQSLTTSDNVP
ncbi:unnamed protein product [Rotaria sp. Silwood2]|nr:unnamed protein product [Rotaria sp. Silwood2]CAF4389248.1 unnamed protein product [Rotaria sp. Silwood2]